jgi:hypothetical protein
LFFEIKFHFVVQIPLNSRHSPGCSRTHDPPSPASPLLGLQSCGSTWNFGRGHSSHSTGGCLIGLCPFYYSALVRLVLVWVY